MTWRVWLVLIMLATGGLALWATPITFTIDKAALVTMVIEAQDGTRVCNLLAETPFPAGSHTVEWDGRNLDGKVAPAGAYKVRGLTHQGIKMVYEFSVNSAGSPAWKTLDHTGGWLADHSPANDLLFLPKGSGSTIGNGVDQLLIAADVGEAGDTLIWVDQQGKKMWGGQKVGGWNGGEAITRDLGPQKRTDLQAYTVVLTGRGGGLWGIAPDAGLRRVCTFPGDSDIPEPQRRWAGIGVAAYNNLVIISMPTDNKLIFIDAKAQKVLGTLPFTDAKGVTFDGAGKLYIITGKVVKRYNVTPEKVELTGETTVISEQLDEPRRLTFDAAGNLYVANWGKCHQVKVFSPQGKFLRAIGKAGGLQLGKYDELQMQHPNGLAIDAKGNLWVAELEYFPKRVSVWSRTGKLLNAFYGPPRYGGGGTIDAQDPTRFFYTENGQTIEYALNWKAGKATMESVSIRREVMGAGVDQWQETGPERAYHINGQVYLVSSFQGGLRGNDNSMIYRVGKDGIAWPVAFIGGDRWWLCLGTKKDVYDKPDNPERLITWSDLNGDHQVQKEEIKYRVMPDTYTVNGQTRKPGYYLQNYIAPDLSMTGAWTIHVDAPTFTKDGIPVYNLDQARFLLPINEHFFGRDSGMPTWPGKDGWIILWKGEGWKDGKLMWRYPQTSDSDPAGKKPGLMVHPTRLLGPLFTPMKGQTGELFALSGEKGAVFLQTTDGLFLQTLGGDMRNTPLWRMKEHSRGMVIENISFEDEHFHPTITQTTQGKVYMVAGKEHSSILRLDGFDTVKRCDFGTVTTDGAPQTITQVVKPTVSGPRDNLTVALRSAAPVLDGKLEEWAGAEWASIDAKASGALCISGDTLYAAYRTDDAKLLENQGGDLTVLFTTGGTLELMLGSVPNDLRVLVTRVKGEMKAMLYRPTCPGAKADEHVLFTSPVGQVNFDQVVEVSSQLKLAQNGGNYEVAIPLSLLQWKSPNAGSVMRGDIGILRGNGVESTQRLYWHNKGTGMVSDIPSEARLSPGSWGTFVVQ